MFSHPADTLIHPGNASPSRVGHVVLIHLVQHCDHRGPLAVLGQDAAVLPFPPIRIFFTHQTQGYPRGAHAHRKCAQILICVAGTCRVLVKDRHQEQEYFLTGPEQALYVGPLVWAEQYDHSTDAVLMVLASHAYDEADYIRDHAAWEQIVQPSHP